MRSIRDTVHGDLETSRAVYAWVAALCRSLGADPVDLVPFEKYAAAAQKGMRSAVIDEIVTRVDAQLAANRAA